MPSLDFFNFFRIGLGWVVSIYATIISLQSLWGWYVWLAGPDKYISLVRRYVILHSLRLRIYKFGLDVLICVLLTIAFFILWHAHHVMDNLKDSVQAARNVPAAIKSR